MEPRRGTGRRGTGGSFGGVGGRNRRSMIQSDGDVPNFVMDSIAGMQGSAEAAWRCRWASMLSCAVYRYCCFCFLKFYCLGSGVLGPWLFSKSWSCFVESWARTDGRRPSLVEGPQRPIDRGSEHLISNSPEDCQRFNQFRNVGWSFCSSLPRSAPVCLPFRVT